MILLNVTIYCEAPGDDKDVENVQNTTTLRLAEHLRTLETVLGVEIANADVEIVGVN